MKFTTYFLKHPIIAIILNGLIILAGFLCFQTLPVREYPEIIFPVITVNTSYPNASPELVESVITNPLEDALAGIEGLDNMTSRSKSGMSRITLSFRSGTSMDKAVNATQEAVSQARAFLPSKAKAPQVERQKPSDGLPFLGIALESTSLDFGSLTHYAHLHLKNSFRSLPGIASVDVWGQPITYDIALDPKKLYAFGVNADEVADAIGQSRLSLPAGNFQNKIPATIEIELKTPADYENLIVKTVNKHPILLKDLARIKMTTDNSQFLVRVNGHAGVVLSINRTADANPLKVSEEVHKVLAKVQQTLPPTMKAKIIVDQSDFIAASLHNIKSSIMESILLVLAIVFIFLRNFKATLIPLVTIPISLIGSLIFLKITGSSVNQLTLLAMVLAVGLVVDDAIVVLENIWRHIEEGLSPMEAAKKGARQIGFAIIAMTLTLASVYAPLAFINGMLGQLFSEFALALAGSVLISGLVALTLSPLMCASLLRADNKQLLPSLDHAMASLSRSYYLRLSSILPRKKMILMTLLSCLGLCLLFYKILPNETAPKEDRGMVGIFSPFLAGENLESIDGKIHQIEQAIQSVPEASNQLTFAGNWGASIVLPLKPHQERRRKAEEIVADLTPKMSKLPSTDAWVWSWDSALPGVDNAGTGAELDLVISSPDDYRDLFKETEGLKNYLVSSKTFPSTRYDLRLDSLGYSIDLNKNTLAKLNLNPNQLARTIEIFFSGDKTLSFQKDSVVYNVNLHGKQMPWSLDELYLTTPDRHRVSLGALATMHKAAQPAVLDHVNQMRSTVIHSQLPAHTPLKDGMNQLWQLANDKLPSHYQVSWTGAAKTFQETSHTMLVLFILALLFIYAILAAQFENFLYPLLILFTVPLACTGALFFMYLFGQSLNIYTQIGLITLIGLISKHGILMVEFANQLRQQGQPLKEAIQQACALRLRPILMTTSAMIFGAIPLILSHSAGAEARRAIGYVLLGGLSLGTLFTLFILPAVYYLILKPGTVSSNTQGRSAKP